MQSPETSSSEQHKSEEIALKMQGVLDRVKQPQNHKALSEAGYDFANERYDAGQCILEKNGFWHDAVREIVVEANLAERDKNGATPLSFSEAKGAIIGYAKALSESGKRGDKRSALAIENIVLGADRPEVEGVDDALKYIEGVLQTKARLGKRMTPEMKNQWDEQRAVRDALFAEKQRRIGASTDKDRSGSDSRLSKEEIAELNKKDRVDSAGIRGVLDLKEKRTRKNTR
ncbi:hypothetical protein KKG36_01475 [Patescibacteria group bacterium]|nr:hypothetical protein [Patescibacteria group bacterium]